MISFIIPFVTVEDNKFLNLPKELALDIGWVPLVYGALSVTNAAVFTLIYRVTFKVEYNLK